MKTLRTAIILFIFAGGLPGFAADPPAVRIESLTVQGPRPLQEQTARAAIRDYLESWDTLSKAFQENDPSQLDHDFIGGAKEKLAKAIQEQGVAGLRTSYHDHSHDVRILFYSPDGLSIQLADTVEYDQQLFDQDKSVAVQHVRTRYIVVLTPTEVRWRVRIFQSQPQ